MPDWKKFNWKIKTISSLWFLAGKLNDISQNFTFVKLKLVNFSPYKTRYQELDSNETFIFFIFLQDRQLVILWLKKLIFKPCMRMLLLDLFWCQLCWKIMCDLFWICSLLKGEKSFKTNKQTEKMFSKVLYAFSWFVKTATTYIFTLNLCFT